MTLTYTDDDTNADVAKNALAQCETFTATTPLERKQRALNLTQLRAYIARFTNHRGDPQ